MPLIVYKNWPFHFSISFWSCGLERNYLAKVLHAPFFFPHPFSILLELSLIAVEPEKSPMRTFDRSSDLPSFLDWEKTDDALLIITRLK